MKKIAIFVCASFLAGTLPAAVPDGYYDSLSGLSGAALRKAAKAVVRDHKVVSYGTDTWNAFKTTDTHFVNGVNCWWDMYSYDDVSVASGHPGMNIEHSVANSWWGGSKNDAYKDLFHLNPSNSDANSRKSNYPLGEVGTQTWSNGATTIGKPVSGQGGGNNYVYEPCDEYKGDFARVFMYMFTVYDDINWDSSKGWMFDKGSADIFKPWAVELLLKWHRQDPVSDKETARNEAIYGIQRNRNPYIDSPELAEHVWGNMKDKPYQYGGVYVPVDPDPVDPDPVDPDPVDPDPVPDDGIWHLVRSQAEINADDSYVIIGVGKNTSVAMTTRMNSTKYASYFEVEDVEIITDGDRHNYIQELPADVAVLKFIPSGADYKASVNTLAGEQKGWLTCEAVK
ncbi:MAG: endonuclease, partial [Muribaculaceae bacterium]|nr:endonuclease [Muribaculaceae bacterium]